MAATKLISAFVFATQIVYLLLFILNPNPQAFSRAFSLHLCMTVQAGFCQDLVGNPRRSVFSSRGSIILQELKVPSYINDSFKYRLFSTLNGILKFENKMHQL